jgi:hypothetical protein
MSTVPLRDRHRVVTVVAIAMLGSVGVYWVVVELSARLQKHTPAFPGEVRIGYLAVAVGVIVAYAASIVRRSMLAGGPGDAGARIQVASIVTFALAETPAVLGVVAFLLTGLREAAYPLFVVALAAHALYFPRWSQWEEWARAAARPTRR